MIKVAFCFEKIASFTCISRLASILLPAWYMKVVLVEDPSVSKFQDEYSFLDNKQKQRLDQRLVRKRQPSHVQFYVFY